MRVDGMRFLYLSGLINYYDVLLIACLVVCNFFSSVILVC